MINEDGSPNTAHTTNLVPVWSIASNDPFPIHDGSLCDIATWVKACLGIAKPIPYKLSQLIHCNFLIMDSDK